MSSGGNTQPAQGGIPGFLAKAPDPLGISNGGGGLDPLNLMGSPASVPGVPSVLPNLGARSMMPIQPYGKFVQPQASGGGFNGMAARAAGPLFDPSAGAPAWQALMAALAPPQVQTAPGKNTSALGKVQR